MPYKNNFRIVTIADSYFGKKDDNKLYNELKINFLDVIQEIQNEDYKINMVCIAGDLFDRIIKMNEYSAKLIFDFVSDLCYFSQKYHVYLRILKGTKTHDFNQLQVFKNLELKYSNFRIINTVETEKINGIKILYLPEEYPENIYEYYNVYLNQTYDCILGHGMIDCVAFVPDDNSERMVRNAPVWKLEDLMNICNGPVIFGHIHDFHEFKDKVYYCGSFSRFSFADKEDKGFLMFDINEKNTKEYEGNFYENENAPTYKTIDINDFSNLDNEAKIKLINNIKKEYDFVKIKAESNSSESLDIIKNITSEDPSIKMEIKNISVEENKVDEKYLFILKREYDIFNTIQKFIKIKYNKDISTEKIKSVIS